MDTINAPHDQTASLAMVDNPRLYVGNLPYVAQQSEVEKLFVDCNIPIKDIDMSIDPFTGRNPSYCFVDLHDADDANSAMQTMQGMLVRNRPIKVNLNTKRRTGPLDTARPPTKVYDRGWKAKQVPSKDVGPDAYVFDRWARDDAPTHWEAPYDEGRRVYVGGLPQIPNQDSLNVEMRELFSDWNIQAVSKIISPNETKRHLPGSQHYCFIDFPTAQEAQDAVRRMNEKSTPYGGRYKVDIARFSRPGKVHKEQLGRDSFKGEEPQKPAPRRNLEGSWRRPD